MTFLDNLKEETTVGRTANGASTFTSSLNANLDFYAQAGSMRQNKAAIKPLFAKAYDEDREIALRNLIHLRNIRLGGLGERDAFRIAVQYLIDAKDYKAITMIAESVGYFGRWDDLVSIMAKDTKTFDIGIEVLKEQFAQDLDAMEAGETVSLMAKWVPNVSVKNAERRHMAHRIAKALGYTPRDYRKVMVKLRSYIGVLEVKLAAKEYNSINFEKLPSKALFRYRAAFNRHLEDEYHAFIEAVNSGEKQMNGKLMMPHEVVRAYGEVAFGWSQVEPIDAVLEATWKSMDDVLKGVEDNAIVVADTSGSMTSTGGWGSNNTVAPWNVAEGLAIYTAERLEGAFKNNFITFSTRPQLVTLPEHGTLRDKMKEYRTHSIIDSTNIEAVFDLILDTAVKNGTPQEDLPSKIVIISDMEFNICAQNASLNNFDNAKRKFNAQGYELPSVVFWNVNAHGGNMPVRFNEQGVALVSGFSTNVLSAVLGGEISSPEEMMLKVLNKPEYDFIKLGL